ncbi:hypothetical protein FHQ18_09090 [Deferribacter autotrophicus]|uniref:Uncharacterized protein n=1 Tax=Deferribacter autotrophicus TaxID=500465 RepID=A0A5A8F6T8_9BACT|nr:hypothetical protein [Deferribacter autotrophicus]KAA0257487.1 hypothetical protein FHQ18_09090 [Deferribacter autotrophicus]
MLSAIKNKKKIIKIIIISFLLLLDIIFLNTKAKADTIQEFYNANSNYANENFVNSLKNRTPNYDENCVNSDCPKSQADADKFLDYGTTLTDSCTVNVYEETKTAVCDNRTEYEYRDVDVTQDKILDHTDYEAKTTTETVTVYYCDVTDKTYSTSTECNNSCYGYFPSTTIYTYSLETDAFKIQARGYQFRVLVNYNGIHYSDWLDTKKVTQTTTVCVDLFPCLKYEPSTHTLTYSGFMHLASVRLFENNKGCSSKYWQYGRVANYICLESTTTGFRAYVANGNTNPPWSPYDVLVQEPCSTQQQMISTTVQEAKFYYIEQPSSFDPLVNCVLNPYQCIDSRNTCVTKDSAGNCIEYQNVCWEYTRSGTCEEQIKHTYVDCNYNITSVPVN